jgi:HD superfamily phosphohydrolase
MYLTEEKVFKDPVHRYIYVQDQPIWDLINTKEFQRLRRIRQLGTSYFTFHGSEHSRFSHSLGVYEITRRIISQFERNQYKDWPREERLVSLCAALLHDVGHGPFSHSFEQAFGTDHEEWTCRIIAGNTEVHQVLTRIAPDFPMRVADVICKTYPQTMVTGLISSQMDADRMDYLLRDAYFTGVHYGTFDLERILRVMRPYQGKIVIKESGMHAVEDYLMSRYQMYWQVYFHPVTRSGELILRGIFKRVKSLYEMGYRFQSVHYPMIAIFDGNLTLEEYLFLDEAVVQTMIKHWSLEPDPILADLCRRFENRNLLKYMTFSFVDSGWFSELCERFRDAGMDPDYYLTVDSPSDQSYDMYLPGEDSKRPIYLINARDELSEISSKSSVIRSISGVQHGDMYLFYPEDLLREPTVANHRIHEMLRMAGDSRL